MARILVVDDDPDILRLMQFTLSNAKHTVVVAPDGPTALNAIKKQTPDLMIVDIMMPHMTGYQFTQRVRAMPGLERLPILVYSARFQPIDQETAINAGATDYMPKTVAPAEIVLKVAELLAEDAPGAVAPGGKTIGFFSLRGGVGVSTLAVNIAAVIGLSKKAPTVLADLHPLAGHAGLMLGLRPQKSLADLQRTSGSLTAETLKGVLASHPKTGVRLLASPLVRRAAPILHNVETIVREIKSAYPFAIFDLPSAFSKDVLAVLPLLDKLVLVTAPDLPSLQSAAVARKTIAALDAPPKRVCLVFNSNTATPTLKRASMEKTLRTSVYAEIPFEPTLCKAIHSGQPPVLGNPQAAYTTAIAQLAAKLLKE